MQRRVIRSIAAVALFATAIFLGYALSSSLSRDYLRLEAETQLTSLMRGPTAIRAARLRVGRGLWIEGEDVKVYPGESHHGLTGRLVSARIDLIALLTGRFRLRALVLEGVHMEIERNQEDVWWPHPIATLDTRGRPEDPDDLELKLNVLRSFEAVLRGLLRGPTVAQRIELRGGSVRLVDHFVGDEGSEPLELEINDIEGDLEFGWLNRSADLHLRGAWKDAGPSATPIEINGARRKRAGVQASIAVTGLELHDLHAYLQPQDPASRREREAGHLRSTDSRPFSGRLSGVLHFLTPEPEHGILEIDWIAQDLRSGVRWGNELLSLDSPRAALTLQLEFHPGRVRLAEADFRGASLGIEVSGFIDRPLRDSSAANFSVDLYGVGLDDARRVVNALPQSQRTPMLLVLDHVKQGTLRRIGGQGNARFATWREILRGKRLDLPEGLMIRAEFEGIHFDSLDGQDQFSNLSGTVEWSEDRITLECPRIYWNERRMPGLDITVDGFPQLFEEEHEKHILQSRASPTPGFSLFREIFFARDSKPETALDELEEESLEEEGSIVPSEIEGVARSFPRIEIEIDRLEHPTLHWPVRDAGVRVDAIEHGIALEIHRGHWGDTDMTGTLHWTRAPEPPHASRIEAMIRVVPRSARRESETPGEGETTKPAAPPSLNEMARSLSRSMPSGPRRDASDAVDSRWAIGRFSVDELASDRLPVSSLFAGFALDGSDLIVSNLDGRLVPKGRLTSRLTFGLADADSLPVDLEFRIERGDADPITRAIGFQDGFAEGRLDARGNLAGVLRPGLPLLAEVDGSIRFKARRGVIHQSVPLVAALSHALEGLNPIDAGDALQFETLEAGLKLDHGRISTEDLHLDGPLRIFISGDFDVARPDQVIDAEIGIFLFRQVDKILGKLPVIKFLIPGGHQKGLFGAYFKASGALSEPELRALKMRTLTEGILLPDLIKTPFKAIRRAVQSESRIRAQKKKKHETALPAAASSSPDDGEPAATAEEAPVKGTSDESRGEEP